MAIPTSTVHGFPRLGPNRELKTATEKFWAGRITEEELLEVGRQIRTTNWAQMASVGIDLIPSNDFSFYDQVLDTVVMTDALPDRYRSIPDRGLDRYFALARGLQSGSVDVGPLEMTKWFDTNYHHLVPEMRADERFRLNGSKLVDEFQEAAAIGIITKPVIVGPVTFLLLAKQASREEGLEPLKLLPALFDVYEELLNRLYEAGVEWVQFDEPALAEDRSSSELKAVGAAYRRLGELTARPALCVSTYFDHAGESLATLADTPIEGIGLDFCAGPGNLELIQELGGLASQVLFAGVVDGRNVWANHLERSLDLLEELRTLASEVVVSTSCSLQHVPISVKAETALDTTIRGWFAFADEKLQEIQILAHGLTSGRGAIAAELETNADRLASRAQSSTAVDPSLRARVAVIRPADRRRQSSYRDRRQAQSARLNLPFFPTTTIGSFPQTDELRTARAERARGTMSVEDYESRIRDEIDSVIALQERLGLDVLVHGEPERNDMVQYFAEQLNGFVITEHAWVQSYGTRYTRPPIIVGDVSRPGPMTTKWTTYAQAQTPKPVKGMLTGPVTMLLWSFARDDLSLADTCEQIALAVHDEVTDLDAAGIAIIQVDEPAFREGLPLRQSQHPQYLAWATACFRLATSPVRDETQIHTHMCYAEFGSVLSAIAELDVDVISFEAARSSMELLDELRAASFDRGVGPGIYDIHSPRVPSSTELTELLELAASALSPERLWVNPDCGLKTRTYEEIEPALIHLVEAAHRLRRATR